MELYSIASGSSGNCIMVGSDNTKLLIDCGISMKRIKEGLCDIGLQLEDMKGILITHEHADHVKGLGVIARKHHLPMYATRRTIEAIRRDRTLGEYDDSLFYSIRPDEAFNIGDIEIEANRIWHDAADPVCYTFKNSGKKAVVATDMGDFDDYIVNKLSGSDIMLIESNHDIRMLEAGPYPYYLKRRILSDHGHLSNERSGKLIFELLNSHIKGIALGHLSHENNYPDLAYETVKNALMDNSFTNDIRDFNLQVAKRECPSVHFVA